MNSKPNARRHYTPIWEAIKAQFLDKNSTDADLVQVEIHKSAKRNLIRMVQKEKWQDRFWGLSSYTKLVTKEIKPSDSGYVIITFQLVPHNKAAIFSQLLSRVNPDFKPAERSKKQFKL